MLMRILISMSLSISLAFPSLVWSYDAAMAQSYAKLFEPVKGAGAGKAMHLMKPDAFIQKVVEKQPLVVLDVRTPAETAVYSATLPSTLVIPLNELFTETNLDHIPTDKTVVVLCKSGTRAAAAGTALRHVGFDNVYILKGGFKALAGYMGPKEAYTPLKAESKPESTQTMPVPPPSSGRPPMPYPYPPRPTW